MASVEPQTIVAFGSKPPSYDQTLQDGKLYQAYSPPGFSQDVLPSNVQSSSTYPQPVPVGTAYYPAYNEAAATNVTVIQSSVDVQVPADVKHGETYMLFSERSIRMAFIRKVYIILSMQLLITFGFISLFIFVEPIKLFCLQNWWMMMVSLGTMLFCMVLMCFVVAARRKFPLNLILLLIFTLCESFAIATLTTYFSVSEVLIAFGITMFITFSVTIFSLQSKWDFTIGNALIFVSIAFGIIFAVTCGLYFGYGWDYHCTAYVNIYGFISYNCYSSAWYLIFCALFAFIFSMYLVVDTYWMIGGKHKYGISPEEYIFASLNLYLDIIMIFLYILALLGGGNRN